MKLCEKCQKEEAVSGLSWCKNCIESMYKNEKPYKAAPILTQEYTDDHKAETDLYAWNLLFFFVEIACQNGEITQELYASLNDALMSLKPKTEPRF